MVRSMCWGALFAIFLTGTGVAAESKGEPLVVFAAASLTDVLQQTANAYTKSTGTEVKLSFAASSALAKQIESGAKADVFVSADQEWMDYLDSRALIDRRSRSDVLANTLVLIAPSDSKLTLKLGRDAPVLQALGANGKLATGDPDSVPVGKYAKAALTSLNVWRTLESRIARADNVRVALMYVARGEAPLGIVYATDAAAEPKVRVVDTFPADSHPPITYPVALTSVAQSSAKQFVDYLRGANAQATFQKAGFKVLGAAAEKSSECTDFRFDVSRELAMLKGAKTDVVAGPSAQIMPGRAYRVSLRPQAEVQFTTKPGKPTMNEGSYAGAVKINPAVAGNLRVALNEAAWIDVLANGRALTSTSHSGSHNCAAPRKAVQFDVKKAQPLVLQFSGSTAQAIDLVVTQ